MAIDIFNIQPNVVDPSLNQKVFWFYGEAGTRKTSIASKFPDPLIIATERGYKFISGVRAADVSSWADMRQILKQLRSDEAKNFYKTIVIDRADTLYDYCKEYICKTQGIKELGELAYSAGYTLARKEFASIFRAIESLGYGMVFITHDKVNMDKLTTQDLENNAAKTLKGYADFTFFLKKENIEDKKTVIAYSDKANTDSKSRARYFTDSFEFTYENLVKELKIAIEKEVEMEGIEVKVQERKEMEKRDFEEIKASVIEKYTAMLGSNNANVSDVEDMINRQMQGTRISEADESFYDRLLTIETFILGLEQ